MCLQLEYNSLLLLRVAPFGSNAIKYFSLVQRAQIPDTGLKGLARSTISHLISKFMFLCSSSCVRLLRVVWLACSLLNVCLWPLHLSLNLLAVNPVYVCISPPSSVIVALYITSLSKHLPWTGQSSFISQLQVLISFIPVGSSSFELWAEMAAMFFLC